MTGALFFFFRDVCFLVDDFPFWIVIYGVADNRFWSV